VRHGAILTRLGKPDLSMPSKEADKTYRTDTPAARDFLGDFVTLP
jgi:hypothetical protein